MIGCTASRKRWGATPDEWHHFSEVLGLTSELLPVVLGPRTRLRSASAAKHVEETPSQYDESGAIVRLDKWTSLESTPADVTAWATQADHGICVQTRRLAAFYIDVNDWTKALTIAGTVARLQPRADALPVRYLNNSAKLLLPFRAEGMVSNSQLRTRGGRVLLLGQGQLFVAAGTHPSGERYRWGTLRFLEDRAEQ